MVSVVPYIITFNENTLILSTFFVFWSMTLFLVFLGCHLSGPALTYNCWSGCLHTCTLLTYPIGSVSQCDVLCGWLCGCLESCQCQWVCSVDAVSSFLLWPLLFCYMYLLLKLSPPSLQAPTLWAACPFSLFSLHPHYRLEDTIDRKVTQGSLQMDRSPHCCHSLLWIDCLHFCCLCPATPSMRTKRLSSTLGWSPC